MNTRRLRHVAARLVACLLLLALSCPAWAAKQAKPQDGQPRPCFSGTFFQPLADHAGWSQAQWKTLFDRLADLKVHDVVVQWSAMGGVDFAGNGVLGAVLDQAQARGMQVWLGLNHPDDFWTKAARQDNVVAVYLRGLQLANAETARKALDAAKGSPAFAGWYLTEELDDTTWGKPERRAVIGQYLRNMRQDLAALAQGKPVLVSGFANGFLSPAEYADFVREFMKTSGLDGFLLQDGVGVRKLTVAESMLYLDAASRGARDAGARFIPVVEVLEQTAGQPIDDKPFKAVPASMDRVERQLRAAAATGGRGIWAFSLPEYALPGLGAAQRALYDDYLAYCRK